MRLLDVLAGLIVGGIVWGILSFLLSFIPILGWVIAAIIGGYIAGRLGGGAAALILALFSPILTAVIAGALLSFIRGFPIIGAITPIIGAIFGAFTIIWALINLIFVGIGGYIGSKEYKPEACPYCGARIRKGALICSSCGRELKPGVRPSRVEIISEKRPLTEEKKEEKFITPTQECPFCGERIPVGIEICPICKNRLPR